MIGHKVGHCGHFVAGFQAEVGSRPFLEAHIAATVDEFEAAGVHDGRIGHGWLFLGYGIGSFANYLNFHYATANGLAEIAVGGAVDGDVGPIAFPLSGVGHLVVEYVFKGLSEVIGERNAYAAVGSVEFGTGFPGEVDFFSMELLQSEVGFQFESLSFNNVQVDGFNVVARAIGSCKQELVAAGAERVGIFYHHGIEFPLIVPSFIIVGLEHDIGVGRKRINGL